MVLGTPPKNARITGKPMHRHMKWNIAATRLAGFCSELSFAPNDDDISEFHEVIGLFEDACGQDLSRFKIAPDQVSKTRTEVSGSVNYRWQTRHPVSVVDYRYFRRQVRGLVDFLTNVLNSHLC